MRQKLSSTTISSLCFALVLAACSADGGSSNPPGNPNTDSGSGGDSADDSADDSGGGSGGDAGEAGSGNAPGDNGGSGGSGGVGGEPTDNGGSGGEPAGGGGSGGGSSECTEIETVANAKVVDADEGEQIGFLYADITKPNLGGAGADGLWFEFYSFATGEFQLGTGKNAKYNEKNPSAGCAQCLIVEVDYQPGTYKATKKYFAQSGSINVSTAPSGWSKVTIKLNNVRFREYNFNNDTFVAGSDCITLDKEIVFVK